MNRLYKSIALFALAGCLSCGKSHSPVVSSAQEYAEWINQEENGFIQQKEVNGMVIQVKYVPATYLALKDFELRQNKNQTLDSLLKAYKYSTTFLFDFLPKDSQNGQDIMYRDVKDYKEYVERSMTLNFDLESKIELKTDKGVYRPVLSSLENTYGLSKGRRVYLVFTGKEKKDELLNAKFYDLVYTDDIYNLGILHFNFDLSTMHEHEPTLKQPHS